MNRIILSFFIGGLLCCSCASTQSTSEVKTTPATVGKTRRVADTNQQQPATKPSDAPQAATEVKYDQ